MDTFELQVYKRDKWEFDSYFTDQDSALEEAHRLIKRTRDNGVRVLADKYDEDTGKSGCAVIFSQMLRSAASDKRRGAGPARDSRTPAVGRSNTGGRVAEADFQVRRRRVAPPKKQSIVLKLFAIAGLMLAIGIGVMAWSSGSVNF